MYTRELLPIKDLDNIGACNRYLTLNIDGKKVYCSTRDYFRISNDPNVMWGIEKRPAHIRYVARREVLFPAQNWVVIY